MTGTQYFVAGKPTPVQPLPSPRPQAVQPVVLMGGGPDVDEAYRWMIQQAGITKATGGRFVVIRASGTDAYDPYFYYSDKQNATNIPAVDGFVGGAYLGLTSAETLIITTREAANDPFVNAVVASANALWIAGGDQSNYIRLWKGTPLESTIATLLTNNVPVGGTSAGANVLGEFVFAALNGTVTSAQAVSDPYNNLMTFEPTPFSGTSFLNVPALANTFVDPHFDARDRMGRLVTFVSRTIAPGSNNTGCSQGILTPSNARGIGLDVETALEIQNVSGRYIAQRVTNISTNSSSAVHFLSPLTSPSICTSGTPLSMPDVFVEKLADSNIVFDMTDWWNGGKNPNLPNYMVREDAGVESPKTIPY
ncbi:cyanophycinase [Cupriavidus oxalaticus]|uniref:cyanophycinase n=1 Tax=Cupriavidus oxalaticus TaxID=96344 RepID=UPI00318146CB